MSRILIKNMPDERFRQTIKREELRGNKSRKKIDKEYPYHQRVSRLEKESDLEKVKHLFESFYEPKRKTRGAFRTCYCLYNKKEVVISFNPSRPSTLYSKNEAILKEVYQKILDVLIKSYAERHK